MLKKIIIFVIISLFFSSCKAFKPEKVDTRKVPTNAQDRARQNVNEGQGISLKDIVGGRGTNFEFSTSNPMWRASLEILDFLPLSTVDYSGGMIITDWYSEDNANEAIKITVRFLANEVRTESLKVRVHKKTCTSDQNCKIILLKQNKISEELLTSIIRKAAELEKQSSKKK